MRSKQVQPQTRVKKYRNYNPESLQLTFKEWQEGKMTVYKAAKSFGLPEQTLRDRISGLIQPNVSKSGPCSLLSQENEDDLCQHVKQMALFGYGYSYIELRELATDTAIFSGKLQKNSKLLSEMWLNRFLKRHPDIKGLKPRTLSLVRAKAVSPTVVEGYYTELNNVLTKYNLHSKPHRIFNVDETGISLEHRPPNIIGSKGLSVPAITSARSSNTTVIACCSATGQTIPPYFVFQGKCLSEELLNGALPSTGACMSDKGWANSEIFHTYITDHLAKFVPGGLGAEYTLIRYDGASSHFSHSLIKWALDNKVVIMVLPAHSSHLLQPLDVGVFKPFKSAYNNVCQEFLRDNVGRQITRYDVCMLACKAYLKGLTPSNIVNAFRKTGIAPFNRHVIAQDKFMPNQITTEQSMSSTESPEPVHIVSSFLKKKVPKFVPPIKKVPGCKVKTSGKEITDPDLACAIITAKKKAVPTKDTGKIKFVTPHKATTPQPGPSRMPQLHTKSNLVMDSSDESENEGGGAWQRKTCAVCARSFTIQNQTQMCISP